MLVVGETARAMNFSANGYEKPTNSHTQKHHPVSFKNMYSCGTATAVSVPCMFSSLTRDNFDRKEADYQQNLLDIVKLAVSMYSGSIIMAVKMSVIEYLQ